MGQNLGSTRVQSAAGQSIDETDWAAIHPRLVSTEAFQHRLEHMLVRRTSPTDVVAVTIVETTRTTDAGLDELAAAGLRESLVDCLSANFDAEASIAITDTGRFAILIETAPSRKALIDQIRLTAADLSGPHDLGSREESMSIRAGIAFADDIQRNATVLFRQARRALGLTVAGGIEVFGGDADKANLDKYELIADLARAVRDDCLDVAYNPVVGDDGCNSVLMEAQLQWNHPTRGSIGPEMYVPIADDCGLSTHLHHWLLETSIAQLARWHKAQSDVNLTLCLDVTPSQLEDPGYAAELLRVCQRHSVDPSAVALTIGNEPGIEALHPQLENIAATGVLVHIVDPTTVFEMADRYIDEPLSTAEVTALLDETRPEAALVWG